MSDEYLCADLYADSAILAQNPNTPIEVLIELSKDKDWYVRSAIAQNPNTPIEVLVELSKDEVFIVRTGVAINTNITLDILIKLSKDQNEIVKFWTKKARISRIALLK